MFYWIDAIHNTLKNTHIWINKSTHQMNMINKELHEYLHYNFNLEIYKSFFWTKRYSKEGCQSSHKIKKSKSITLVKHFPPYKTLYFWAAAKLISTFEVFPQPQIPVLLHICQKQDWAINTAFRRSVCGEILSSSPDKPRIISSAEGESEWQSRDRAGQSLHTYPQRLSAQ